VRNEYLSLINIKIHGINLSSINIKKYVQNIDLDKYIKKAHDKYLNHKIKLCKKKKIKSASNLQKLILTI